MILRKSKTPRKSPEKWTFLSLAFTMHLVCTLLIRISIRDMAADGKSSVRNSGAGGVGQNLILTKRSVGGHLP